MSEPKSHWWNLDGFDTTPKNKLDARQQRQMAQEVAREKAEAFNQMEIAKIEAQYAEARERARLTVLKLTDRDKKFLRSLKVAYE